MQKTGPTCSHDRPRVHHRSVDVPGIGSCLLPEEFSTFTGEIDAVEVHDARESPRVLLSCLASGTAVVLYGPYDYADAVFRYCQRYKRDLCEKEEFAHITDRRERGAAFTEARRQKLHRLLLLAQGDALLRVDQSPDLTGLQDWIQEGTGNEIFLIPVRRLQRILTDMRRAREGIKVQALDGTITIRPHVYVPSDQSVPAMFTEYADLFMGKRVLDVGTGTGVLALLAAKLGAAEVVATDINPKAVANARLNVKRFGLEQSIDVREPARLFGPVPGEMFDVILFNAPWIQGEPQTLYDTALYDPGRSILEAFLGRASDHLAEDGVILLQYSDISEPGPERGKGHLNRLILANGFVGVIRHSIARVSRVLGSRAHVFIYEIRRKGCD